MGPLEFSRVPEEIIPLFETERALLDKKLNILCSSSRDKIAGKLESLAEFDIALAEFITTLTPVLFLKDVSPDEKLRSAAAICDTLVQKYLVDLFAREDLFLALKSLESKLTDPVDIRLLDEHLSTFRRNGLELPPEKKTAFLEKKKKLVEIEEQFSKRIIEWRDELWLDSNELEGLPADYIKNLETSNGRYKIKLDYPHYFTFMDNARNSEARKKLEFKFLNRGGTENVALLEEAVRLRAELAHLLGYATHAHFVLDRRMAKNPAAVSRFLDRLGEKLKIKGKAELSDLLETKRSLGAEPDKILSSDWRFLDNEIKKTKYQVDSNEIKNFFPTDFVVNKMFEIYQTLLGVKFVPVVSPSTWHSAVKLFKIEKDNQPEAYFYTDLFPRDGKYTHAAAFQLVSGHFQRDGSYRHPVSAMVANFDPPMADGQPALLSHANVETLFHEFGHIMHQTLTKAKYATFSGTNVKTDFVEAPSQMLENWVWKTEMLRKISGHWKDTSQKLPEATCKKMLEAKLLNSALRYLRQLSFAKIDLTYHTSDSVSSTETYAKIMADTLMIPIPSGTHPHASFGHLMGGYDAGYYGYLWSEVFAEDMFTRFETEGLLSSKTGKQYLSWILEPGGTKDPNDLIRGFLGREPNETAFLKSIGLTQSPS